MSDYRYRTPHNRTTPGLQVVPLLLSIIAALVILYVVGSAAAGMLQDFLANLDGATTP